MQFSQSGVILGAFTSTYLLEITTYYLHAYYLLLILGAFTSTYLLEKPRITQHMTVRWLGLGLWIGVGLASHHAAHDGMLDRGGDRGRGGVGVGLGLRLLHAPILTTYYSPLTTYYTGRA